MITSRSVIDLLLGSSMVIQLLNDSAHNRRRL